MNDFRVSNELFAARMKHCNRAWVDWGDQAEELLCGLRERLATLIGSGEGFVIVTYKHGYVGNAPMLYRPESKGYTITLGHAGVFTELEAKKILHGIGREKYLLAIPADKARELALAAGTSCLDSERGAARPELEAIALKTTK